MQPGFEGNALPLEPRGIGHVYGGASPICFFLAFMTARYILSDTERHLQFFDNRDPKAFSARYSSYKLHTSYIPAEVFALEC